MFHEGDLRSGIALAVQQSKAVFCFVYDEAENSKVWQDLIFNDEQIAQTVRDKAVALRIPAGSQEASFLSSFCPIATVPAIIVVEKGATKGIIPHTAATKHQLRSRILNLLGSKQLPSSSVDDGSQTDASSHPEEHGPPVTATALDAGPSTRSSPTCTPVTLDAPAGNADGRKTSNTGDGESERISRHGTGEQLDSELSTPSKSSSLTGQPVRRTPQQDWARLQRERERQQREERERIKAQIKHDHTERRRLDGLRKQPATYVIPLDPNLHDARHSDQPIPTNIRIQVRTFDGSSLRSAFPKNSTISGEVRPWIDSSTKQSLPYNLKVILTPQPNLTIEAGEEDKSLEDLDINGSCTMVMVPVKSYAESYAPANSSIIGSAVSGGYNLLSDTLGFVLGSVRSVLGSGQVAVGHTPDLAEEGVHPRPLTGQVRVRTLADQRTDAAKKDHQFYNGNQLNFEPRKDDDDNTKKD